MRVHEFDAAAQDVLPPHALGRLADWARSRPADIALRHKRRGRWKAWRWADVAREVDHLAAALRQHGFGPGSRLALSGAFEPTLLLLALAAAAAGGHAFGLSRDAEGAGLRRQLERLQPSHVFVHSRAGATRVLAALAGTPGEVVLFSSQAAARREGQGRVLPLAGLYAGGPVAPARLAWRLAHAAPPLWSEEGTEWEDGLRLLLAHWLDKGEGLAFPESRESATRDRRDVAPAGLLLSSARLAGLEHELESRLPPPGSLTRRVWDWAQGGHALGRRLRARVRRLSGLHRLRRVVVDAPDAVPASGAQGWVHAYREAA